MDTSDVNMLREIFYEAEFGSRSESGVGTLNRAASMLSEGRKKWERESNEK